MEIIKFNCRNCSAGLEVDSQWAGDVTTCPNCRGSCIVPNVSPSESQSSMGISNIVLISIGSGVALITLIIVFVSFMFGGGSFPKRFFHSGATFDIDKEYRKIQQSIDSEILKDVPQDGLGKSTYLMNNPDALDAEIRRLSGY